MQGAIGIQAIGHRPLVAFDQAEIAHARDPGKLLGGGDGLGRLDAIQHRPIVRENRVPRSFPWLDDIGRPTEHHLEPHLARPALHTGHGQGLRWEHAAPYAGPGGQGL